VGLFLVKSPVESISSEYTYRETAVAYVYPGFLLRLVALANIRRPFVMLRGRKPGLRGLARRFTGRNPLAGNGGCDAGHHQSRSQVLQRRGPLVRQP
jgi:hypothetical protein